MVLPIKKPIKQYRSLNSLNTIRLNRHKLTMQDLCMWLLTNLIEQIFEIVKYPHHI